MKIAYASSNLLVNGGDSSLETGIVLDAEGVQEVIGDDDAAEYALVCIRGNGMSMCNEGRRDYGSSIDAP